MTNCNHKVNFKNQQVVLSMFIHRATAEGRTVRLLVWFQSMHILWIELGTLNFEVRANINFNRTEIHHHV